MLLYNKELGLDNGKQRTWIIGFDLPVNLCGGSHSTSGTSPPSQGG